MIHFHPEHARFHLQRARVVRDLGTDGLFPSLDRQRLFEARAELETARVFAGLFAVIIIGLLVESVIFRAIEARTVNLWGMQR